jgi:ACS family pantothenate transporter-like MFS transporter
MTSSKVADERATIDASETIIQETPKRRWVSYIWDTFDKSPEERRLLTKLDAAILSFASLGELLFPGLRSHFTTIRTR